MSGSSTEPQPWSAQSAADFVEAMRRLKAWSDLSYRQLAKRAAALGDYLPHSTTAAALGRDKLPREDVVAAFVRACGCEAETVDAWLAVRKRLVVADPAWAGPKTPEEAKDGAPPDSEETTSAVRSPFGWERAGEGTPTEGRPAGREPSRTEEAAGPPATDQRPVRLSTDHTPLRPGTGETAGQHGMDKPGPSTTFERRAADQPEPGRRGTPPAGSRRRRPLLRVFAGVATTGLVLTLVVAVARSGSDAPPASGAHSPSSPLSPSGPVARWRFDQRAGTSVADSSGHGFLLKLSGRSSRISAPGGGALKLDGAGYASTGRPVIRTDEPFTVAAWVRLDSASQWGTVVSQHDQSYDVFLLDYHKQADRWAFMVPDQAGGAPVAVALSTAPPRLGKWTHLGAVYDGAGRLRLYVDGRLDGTATCPPLGRATGVMDIGRALYEGTQVDPLRGAVNEVSLYARALSAGELHDAVGAVPRLR